MMEFKPFISIIIPCYNYGRFLKECLESVKSQTYKNFEAIIVDDGSTDNSANIAKSFVKKNEQFKYIYQENQGLSATRNTGIRNAKGDYICFVDPDDIWFKNKLEVQIEYLKYNQDCGLLYSDAEIYIDGKPTGRTIRNGNLFYHGFVFEKMLMNNGVVCPSVIIKRDCFKEVGFFDVKLRHTQDWEMWLRISRHFKFCSIPKPLLYYRIHGSNDSNIELDRNFMEYNIVIKRYFEYIPEEERDLYLDNNIKKIFYIAIQSGTLVLSLRIYLYLLHLRPFSNLILIKYIFKIIFINLPIWKK